MPLYAFGFKQGFDLLLRGYRRFLKDLSQVSLISKNISSFISGLRKVTKIDFAQAEIRFFRQDLSICYLISCRLHPQRISRQILFKQ